jgi:hypothetical protein
MPHDLFELGVGLGIAPAGHPHGDERHAAHQHGGDDHPERDVLERAHHSDRAEALADDDHHEAEREGDQCGEADPPEGIRGAWSGRPTHRTAPT